MTPLLRLLMLLPLLFAGAAAAQPPESAVTLYGGWRDGGSFTDVATDRKQRIDGAVSYALAVDRGLDGSRQLQFYLAHQRSDLALSASGSAATTRVPIDVTYLHLGGTNFFDGPIGAGPYMVGGLGVTLLRPGLDGFGSELRPSLNVGFGYQVTLGARLALRLEARGYVTLVNSGGELFCSGGCRFSLKADAVTQGEAMAGLSWRF